MDNQKTGALIKKLRLQAGMTQSRLGEQLNVSDKAVSKWERGLGCPDVSLLGALSDCLHIELSQLLCGGTPPNDFVAGNMKKVSYYICKTCRNIIVSTGNAEISCCGRRLESAEMQKATQPETLRVEQVENDLYITSDHPMSKEHYISFAAFATADKLQIIKLYPEWDMQLRLPMREHGTLLWYCTEHGLFYRYI